LNAEIAMPSIELVVDVLDHVWKICGVIVVFAILRYDSATRAKLGWKERLRPVGGRPVMRGCVMAVVYIGISALGAALILSMVQPIEWIFTRRL
jgi:hypothetical protein